MATIRYKMGHLVLCPASTPNWRSRGNGTYLSLSAMAAIWVRDSKHLVSSENQNPGAGLARWPSSLLEVQRSGSITLFRVDGYGHR